MDVRPTVLIIDDEPLIRIALASLLTRRGYAPVTAASAEDGLRLARETHPDLILLNMQLPDRSGWQVQDELSAEPAFNRTPIVAITGFPAAISRFRATQDGFAGFLEKPFRYSELISTVEEVLALEPERAPSPHGSAE